ncbi:uncharacterized protein ACO6RY_19210 [Pungitius sinensis]
MTRVALTKLLILVILAFIICLPEFFTLDRVPKVNFLCVPYRPCDGGNRLEKGEEWKSGDAEARRKDCGPTPTASSNKLEQDCTQEDESNATDPESDSGRGGGDPEKNWFMCETDVDMAELHRNMSSSAQETDVEVSVKLHLSDAETLNLTLYEGSHRSFLHLHPPEEEEEEGRGGGGLWTAFYCCLPVPPTAESANQRRCLLWLANRTVVTATVQEKLPWKLIQRDEWSGVFRALWLALLCVMVLMLVTIVLGQIYWKIEGSCKRHAPLNIHPLAYAVNGQQLNDAGRHMEMIAPKGMIFHSYGYRPGAGLSPIEEVHTQEDIETLLDVNDDHCCTANLHHRMHPSTMLEQTC